MKIRLPSIQRIMLAGIVFFLGLPLAAGATGWEGRAEAAEEGAFPGEGAYLASNAVSRNTVVEIINLETGERAEATVTRRLTRPGVLARVSPALAETLGISKDERIPVRMTAVSVPGISDLTDEDEQALSQDPDINPQARARRSTVTEIPHEMSELDPAEVEPDELPEPAEHDIDEDREIVASTEPRPSEIRGPAISTDRLRPDVTLEEDVEEDIVEEPRERRSPELPEMRDPRDIDEAAETAPMPERDIADTQPGEPEIETDEPEDLPQEPEEELREAPRADPQRVLEDLLGPPEEEDVDVEDPEDPEVAEEDPEHEEREPIAEPEDEPGTGELPVVDELSADSYYLQVSAHRSVEAAVRTVRSLEQRYPLAVTEHGEGEERLFRILVGPVNRDERGALLIDLRSLGFRDAFVRHGGQS